MGNRLYVAKTYKVEFAYGMGFNYMVSELHDLQHEFFASGATLDLRFRSRMLRTLLDAIKKAL